MAHTKSIACYLCGEVKPNMTMDHIPPKGFFPVPRPTNLIKIPCCQECNFSYSADDEVFRAWVTAPENISPAGKAVFEGRVVPNTLSKPKLLANIRKYFKTTIHDGKEVDTLTFPQARANRFLTRIAKGLLWLHHPATDREKQTYRIVQVSDANRAALAPWLQAVHSESRGNGVFRFWGKVEASGEGRWMFLFYESSAFSVYHRPT